MGYHHAEHHPAKQQEHQVQETSATFYRAVGCDVDGPLNGEAVFIDAVHMDMIALHTSIGDINRHVPAELVDLESSVVIGGDAG